MAPATIFDVKSIGYLRVETVRFLADGNVFSLVNCEEILNEEDYICISWL